MDEVALAGGNMGPVSRRADVVLRQSGPWTPAVHRLLAHCRARGLAQVPEPLGVEADGREALTFMPGQVPQYPLPRWIWREQALLSSVELLRRFHDASADADRTGPWRSAAHGPEEVVCHNDFAPYNLVYRDGVAVGIIDFDFASPGSRIWDLAYLAYRMVPLTTDRADGFSDAERAARLALACAHYDPRGSITPSAVLETAVSRLRELADFSDRMAVELANPELHEHSRLYRADAAAIASNG